MELKDFKRNVLSAAIAATTVAAPVAAQANDYWDDYKRWGKSGKKERFGDYRSGDFHNHTTCSDGSTSVRTLTRKSLTFHDWFIHVGHSGSGTRDCRVDDFLTMAQDRGVAGPQNGDVDQLKGRAPTMMPPEGSTTSGVGDGRGLTGHYWTTNGVEIKGNNIGTQTLISGDVVQRMWRWQSLQEYNLDPIVDEREFPGNEDKVAFLGLEWVVPGHEHSSNSLIRGQYEDEPNADALAQYEYCFARNSDDDSQGAGQGWTCEVSASGNEALKTLFADRPDEGPADYNGTLDPTTGINTDDTGDHVKATASMLWMQENYPNEGFHVQAHLERQGGFFPGQNKGWNIEHMRDMHTVAPEVSFGFESQPGHQAQPDRGGYRASGSRVTAGMFTFGGTGAYAGAEVSRPGEDFDGNPIETSSAVECQPLGLRPVECANDRNKVVIGRPGVRTMWDAMLSEGRRFWFFGSSDWHNRGAFGPLDVESTNDFWPGEFQDNYVKVIDNNPDNPAQDIVDGLRRGNVFVVMGQLIDAMKFTACAGNRCATMGETLKVRKGQRVRVTMTIRDPRGKSLSPYAFNNPMIAQLGKHQPLDEPSVQHVEFIAGKVTEPVPVRDAHGNLNDEYFNPLAPESTRIVRQFTPYDYGKGEIKRMSWSFRARHDSYVRARGGNLPPGTPHAVDFDGNPLRDDDRDNISCIDPQCPPHLPVNPDTGKPYVDYDLQAWADLWFYANPIFIEVEDRKSKGGWYAWSGDD